MRWPPHSWGFSYSVPLPSKAYPWSSQLMASFGFGKYTQCTDVYKIITQKTRILALVFVNFVTSLAFLSLWA